MRRKRNRKGDTKNYIEKRENKRKKQMKQVKISQGMY